MGNVTLAGAAVALVLAALSAHVGEAAPGVPRSPAPGFSAPVWFNSQPLTLDKLRGKVALVDFWEYTCINCIRTFPHLRRWNRLYGPLGLVIIGVHTPEFDFARDPVLVEDAVRRFRFKFPVAVDSERKVWDAFHNSAWPADYLIDANGRIAGRHVGEGGYAMLETEIQRLLKEANPALDFSAAQYRIPEDEPESGGACMRPTPETYLGMFRAGRLANEGGIRAVDATYAVPKIVPLDMFALDGPWMVAGEFIRRTPSADEGAPSSLLLHYGAAAVYLVAGSDGRGGERLYVSQDAKPLPEEARGGDVRADPSGRTYLPLGKQRMYYVVNNPRYGEHTLVLAATSSALKLYSFTFGNDCESKFDHW